jgi:hypothetical protein
VKAGRSLKAISNHKKELPDLNEVVATKSSLIRTYIAHLGFFDESGVGWRFTSFIEAGFLYAYNIYIWFYC